MKVFTCQLGHIPYDQESGPKSPDDIHKIKRVGGWGQRLMNALFIMIKVAHNCSDNGDPTIPSDNKGIVNAQEQFQILQQVQ